MDAKRRKSSVAKRADDQQRLEEMLKRRLRAARTANEPLTQGLAERVFIKDQSGIACELARQVISAGETVVFASPVGPDWRRWPKLKSRSREWLETSALTLQKG